MRKERVLILPLAAFIWYHVTSTVEAVVCYDCYYQQDTPLSSSLGEGPPCYDVIKHNMKMGINSIFKDGVVVNGSSEEENIKDIPYYNGNSSNQDDFGRLVDCSKVQGASETYCVQTVTYDWDMVIRGCASRSFDTRRRSRYCMESLVDKNRIGVTCICDDNYCNAAMVIGSFQLTILFVLSGLLYYK